MWVWLIVLVLGLVCNLIVSERSNVPLCRTKYIVGLVVVKSLYSQSYFKLPIDKISCIIVIVNICISYDTLFSII